MGVLRELVGIEVQVGSQESQDSWHTAGWEAWSRSGGD